MTPTRSTGDARCDERGHRPERGESEASGGMLFHDRGLLIAGVLWVVVFAVAVVLPNFS